LSWWRRWLSESADGEQGGPAERPDGRSGRAQFGGGKSSGFGLIYNSVAVRARPAAMHPPLLAPPLL